MYKDGETSKLSDGATPFFSDRDDVFIQIENHYQSAWGSAMEAKYEIEGFHPMVEESWNDLKTRIRNTLTLIIGMERRKIVGDFFIEKAQNHHKERIRKMVEEILSKLEEEESEIIDINNLPMRV